MEACVLPLPRVKPVARPALFLGKAFEELKKVDCVGCGLSLKGWNEEAPELRVVCLVVECRGEE